MSAAEQTFEMGPEDGVRDRRRAWPGRYGGWRRSAVAMLAGVSIAAAAAPAARAETLTQALAYAYYNNPKLLAQRAALRATDERVPQALANWRPTVTFTGKIGRERVNSVIPINGNAQHTNSTYKSLLPRSLDLQLVQPVYRGGRTEAETRQAISTVEAARAKTLSIETQVFQAVAKAYLDVVRDQTLVEVNSNNEAVLRKQLEATQDRFRVGEVTRTDVAQAESKLAQATADRIAAEGQLQGSRATYTSVVGHPPGRLVLPRERPALPKKEEQALDLAAHDNFEVISAQFSERAARAHVADVRGQLLPQISIVGDLSRAYDISSSFKDSRFDSASITAQMTMPLYQGGAVYSQVREAEQQVGQQRSLVDQARRDAVQAATRNWQTLQAARAAIASYGKAVRAAQIALQGTEQEALVGTRTVLDVLIATQQLFTTQSQLVTAQHDAALAEFDIAAAIGRFVAPDLKLPVKLYDLDHHYEKVRNKWFGFAGGLSQ